VIPSGSYVATVGSASVNLTVGVSGPGVLSSAGSTLLLGPTTVSGAVNIIGGNTTFTTAGSNVSILTITGGFTIFANAVQVKQLNLLSGNAIGAAGVTASQLYFSSQGFNLNTGVWVTKTASVGGLLSFGSAGGLWIESTATFQTLASVTFTGVPGMTVTNNGILNVISPVVFTNINLAGGGSVTVQSTLSVQTATVTQTAINLSGAGIFKGSNTKIINIGKVAANPTVQAQIGVYSFTCPAECDDISTSGVPTSAFTFTA